MAEAFKPPIRIDSGGWKTRDYKSSASYVYRFKIWYYLSVSQFFQLSGMWSFDKIINKLNLVVIDRYDRQNKNADIFGMFVIPSSGHNS